jgi:hypothetical protein
MGCTDPFPFEVTLKHEKSGKVSSGISEVQSTNDGAYIALTGWQYTSMRLIREIAREGSGGSGRRRWKDYISAIGRVD